MVKKAWIVILAAIMVLAMAGCQESNEVQPEEQVDYDIAMVTESGMIMNGGYSEAAWETISSFGEANGISHKYYKATEASDDSYRQAIDAAVSGGAGIIVCDGYTFSQVVYEKQEEYPNVKFVMIDAVPADAESGEENVGENTSVITFDSAQAGYLAGYSAVKDGLTELGFLGEEKQPVVMDYCYGFIQGANKAAAESGISVNVKYHYCGEDDDREAILAKADEWYESGVQAVFACGSETEQAVIESAEKLGGKVIACETDKSEMSDTILTSTVNDIGTVLESVLQQYEDDEFPGGEVISYDVSNDGVSLAVDTGRFSTFENSDYEDIVTEISDGNVNILGYDSGGIDTLGLSNVNVTEE